MAGPSVSTMPTPIGEPSLNGGPSIPPLPPDATPEQKDAHWFKYVYAGDRMPQLTLRAIIMGGILGMLMAASNLYTTLTIGWSFGVAITACVLSFVIWAGVSWAAGTIPGRLVGFVIAVAGTTLIWWKAWPLFGAIGQKFHWSDQVNLLVATGMSSFLTLLALGAGVLLWFRQSKMSLLENNCMQSTASAAGASTGATISVMFGALVVLKEIPEGKTAADIATWDVSPWWAVGGFTLATAALGCFLAVPMKRQMINHEQLRFPSGVAAAETLQSLYSQSQAAMDKVYSLITGLIVGLVVGLLNTGEGSLAVIDRFFKFTHLRLPDSIPGPVSDKFPGSIMYFSGRAAAGFNWEPSVLLLAAGVITRLRVCISMFVGSCLLYFIIGPYLVHVDQQTPGSGWTLVNGAYEWSAANRAKDVTLNIELNGSGMVLKFTTWALWGGTAVMVFASLTTLALGWKTIARAFTGFLGERKVGQDELDPIEVPMRWMVIGLIPITLALVAVQVIAFDIAWWAGLISVGMAFFLSLVACRATGETDTTPIGAMGKVMQLTFAVLQPQKWIPNLAAAGVAANSASSSADLLTDLKSGYLLGANPRKQFLAQFFGVFFGTVAILPVWYLMVPNKEALQKYALPATLQWVAVAKLLTEGLHNLPWSARYAIMGGAMIGMAIPIAERLVPSKYRGYLPSAMGLGLSWVIPFGNALSFFLGAVIGWIWETASPKSSSRFSIALASGLIAGESLMKAVVAMAATAIGIFGG
jgi:OPT family oligopeptide transporter